VQTVRDEDDDGEPDFLSAERARRNRQVFASLKPWFASWELWDGNGPEHRRVAMSGKVPFPSGGI
jgi:hypothetical protein